MTNKVKIKRRSLEHPAIDGGVPVRSSFLPYSFHWIDECEISEVLDTVRSGWLTSGPKVLKFERQFAEFIGSKHAVSVSNGSAALHLSMLACGIKPGSEVITTPLTFISTVNAIVHAGGIPVFADIVPGTLNIDPEQVESKITRQTKAILPVHYGGQPCDMGNIQRIAKAHKLLIAEDATHALGGSYRAKSIGTIGDVSCFSFHPSKNITTAEGGMVTTDNPQFAAAVRALRFHGFTDDYMSRAAKKRFQYPGAESLGFKCLMTDLQASIGIHQLGKVVSFNERRAHLAQMYGRELANIPEISCPIVRPDVESAWHLYVIRLAVDRLRCTRDQFIDALKIENIGASVHYLPIHYHPYYARRLQARPGLFPNAEAAYREIVSLPLFPKMTDGDLQDVVCAVRRLIKHFRK